MSYVLSYVLCRKRLPFSSISMGYIWKINTPLCQSSAQIDPEKYPKQKWSKMLPFFWMTEAGMYQYTEHNHNCTILTSEDYFFYPCLKRKVSISFLEVENRALVILRRFLIFRQSEPRDSDKMNSYKNKCVYIKWYSKHLARIFELYERVWGRWRWWGWVEVEVKVRGRHTRL